ncbi:MAG: OmpA family protein [Planctomycetota bacterium]
MAKPKKVYPKGAPAYMVSFGDMITIMLTFFILLCSYSSERQSGFVSDGIGSFKESLNTFGLPGIMPGVKHPVDLGANKVRFKPARALNYELLESEDGDLDDLNRNALRQVVKESLKEDKVSRIPIVFIFDFQKTKLTAEHQTALDQIGPILASSRSKIRIEGFAYEEDKGRRASRKLAWERAQSIANYMTREHGIAASRVSAQGHGTGGKGVANRRNRVVQDYLGRRIAVIYLVPEKS